MKNKKYDVGIVGWWYGENYGSMLTYYCLNKTLTKLGYSVLMIHEALGYNGWRVKWSNDIAPMRFALKHYQTTEQCYYTQMSKYNALCDTFIVGSDQLWNPHIGRVNDDCFLDFVSDNNRRISYATSFGNKKKLGDKFVERNRTSLRKFAAVSVREYYAVDMARDEFGVEATQVVDPVFLLETDDYSPLANEAPTKIEGDYLFAFILDPTKEKRLRIEEIAKKAQLLNVVVMTNATPIAQEKCHNIFNGCMIIDEIAVENFLYSMKNAQYVVTDSFHGCCFSAIFNRNFSTFYNTKRGADRFESLLGLLGLTSRRIYENSDDISINSIDYTFTNSVILSERERSLAWLQSALTAEIKREVIDDTNSGVPETLLPYYATASYTGKANEAYSVCPKNACTGCAACADKCAFSAVAMIEDGEGFLYPRIDDSVCTECGLCARVCPVLNPSVEISANARPREVYAAFSLDEETRFMSTSGGAFSEFAKHVLRAGGVCYGAAYDEQFNVRHARISDLEELPRIRQSKYYQSITGGVYNRVKKDLEAGTLTLFCGTPCQCAGLSNRLEKNYDNLLIVDFICHSVNSPKAFMAYLRDLEENEGAKASRIWFKNKEEGGWHKFGSRVDFKDKEDYYRQYWPGDAFMKGFLKYRLFFRPSCHECRFKEFKRSADVTLGDFWGLKWNNPQMTDDQKNGVSVVVINSEKGAKIFHSHVKQNMYTEQHTIEEVIPKNGGLLRSQKPGLYRDFFFEQVDKTPFSRIISAIDARELKITAEREAAKAAPAARQQTQSQSPGITGKLTRFGNVVINMHETARIVINGELVLNSHLPPGSQKECILILHKNAKLIVNGRFALAYDSVLQIFEGGTLTLNGGFINAGATIAVKGNSIIGKDFLCGRHFVLHDSDFHQIIDAKTGERINKTSVPVHIGDHVWSGEGVTVLKGVTIGNGSIVGAKSVVTKNVPENCAVTGNPAHIEKTDVSWKH
jgi:acetyltransferase-like isoleucine patch superfamily enzyme/coenzyme F420-reducing hydrogenase beta subunit